MLRIAITYMNGEVKIKAREENKTFFMFNIMQKSKKNRKFCILIIIDNPRKKKAKEEEEQETSRAAFSKNDLAHTCVVAASALTERLCLFLEFFKKTWKLVCIFYWCTQKKIFSFFFCVFVFISSGLEKFVSNSCLCVLHSYACRQLGLTKKDNENWNAKMCVSLVTNWSRSWICAWIW